MKVNPHRPTHRPAPKRIENQGSQHKGMFDRLKDTAGQTIQKTKEVASKAGEKIRALFRGNQNSFTTHAADNKANTLLGRNTSQVDVNFAQSRAQQTQVQAQHSFNTAPPSAPSLSTPTTQTTATSQTAPGAGGGGETHTVQPGDTLSGIAAQHNIQWQDLAAHNGIQNPNALQVGQVLQIPDAQTTNATQDTTNTNQSAAPTAPTTTTTSPNNGLHPEGMHMNQFDGDPNGSNADCGPTSMAMALRGVGLSPNGIDGNASTVDTVQAMRQSMYPNDAGRDGVTVNAQGETVRSDAEHSGWTNFGALITGAEAAGAQVEQIAANSDDVARAVQQGMPVVVNGNPGTDGGGWSNSYNDGHFITVSGYNPENETFTINDPLDNGPREVSKEQLDSYMEGWSSRALAISNPNPQVPAQSPREIF